LIEAALQLFGTARLARRQGSTQQMIAPRAVDIPLAKIQVDFGAAD
jgi:hypothetical protein